jgi:hypothetical protein
MLIERKFLAATLAVFLYIGGTISFAHAQSETPIPSDEQVESTASTVEDKGPANRVIRQLGIGLNVQVPKPNIASGLQIQPMSINVLFANYPSMGLRFFDNKSTRDVYVPQANEAEYRGFLKYAGQGLIFAYAVPQVKYTAVPSACNGTWDKEVVANPDKITDNLVPKEVFSLSDPIIINGYTRLNGSVAEPAETKTTIGSLTMDSPIKFFYRRNDCSDDGIGNKNCHLVDIIEAQEITFSAMASGNNYVWDISNPSIKSAYYANINFSEYRSIDDCSISLGPPVDGACGAANGQSFSEAPKSGLCVSGTASRVKRSNGWMWTCNGISGGASAVCEGYRR